MSEGEMDWEAVGAALAQRGLRLLPGERRRFSGGFANRIYLIELATGKAVLRRPPPGPLPPGAHDMAREHRILSRLPDALDFVPRSLLLVEDEAVIGVKFQVIEYRAGVVLGGATLPAEYAGSGAALSETMLSTLAALHRVDPAAVGLEGLGRPEGFLARAVEGWVKRGHAAEGGALIGELGEWLRIHAVPDGVPTLLHNDFKLDNMILDPATLRPNAVVDWDQGTRGDPLFDLATLLSYWAEPGDPPAMHDLQQMPTASAGFPTREAAALRWSALTGRDLSDFRFHRVLALLKLAVIFLQLHGLYRRGAVTDARYAGFGDVAQGMLASGARWRRAGCSRIRSGRAANRTGRLGDDDDWPDLTPTADCGRKRTMDFTIPPELTELQERTRIFIRETIIPLERDERQSPHGPSDEFRRELNGLAAEAGLLAPHVAHEYGGLGLGHFGRAVVFEEAGYSVLGPLAMNLSAPDEGNMHLLEVVGTEAQKERWLKPLATGAVRSCFAMTEPPPGAGSDPAALSTTAVRDGHEFVITGEKWFITGAVGAGFAIVMAKGEDGKATMFLTDMDRPGIRIKRVMDTIDEGYPGGHAVLVFDGLRVPAENVLGEVGAGFRYAQVRLAPARLTHCMRWLGAARRAQDIALGYAAKREAFGKTLGQHEGVGFMLADNEMEIRSSRLMIWHTAWLLDQGERAGTESSIAKVMCSEAIYRVADRCVQVLGGQGVSSETVVERVFREVRAFRIYDGPSEVHRWSLAQKLLKHGANSRGF